MMHALFLGTSSDQIFHRQVWSGQPSTFELEYKFYKQALFSFWFDEKIIKLAAQLRIFVQSVKREERSGVWLQEVDFEVASFENRTAEYRQGQNTHKKHQVLSGRQAHFQAY